MSSSIQPAGQPTKRSPSPWLLGLVPVIWSFDFLAQLVAGINPNTLPSGLQILVSTGISWGLTLALLWAVLCRAPGLKVRRGFQIDRVSDNLLAISMGTGFAGALLALVIMALFSTGESMMSELTSTPEGLAAVAVVALLVPALEELYYRGFLYPIFSNMVGGVGAVAAVSVWFASAHMMQLAGDPSGIVVILLMGTLWTVLRHLSGSITAGTISHLVYNGTLVALAVAGQLVGGPDG